MTRAWPRTAEPTRSGGESDVLGQALLETVLPAGTSAQLWAVESNPRGRRFYERNGFLADDARYVDETVDLPEVRHVR